MRTRQIMRWRRDRLARHPRRSAISTAFRCHPKKIFSDRRHPRARAARRDAGPAPIRMPASRPSTSLAGSRRPAPLRMKPLRKSTTSWPRSATPVRSARLSPTRACTHKSGASLGAPDVRSSLNSGTNSRIVEGHRRANSRRQRKCTNLRLAFNIASSLLR